MTDFVDVCALNDINIDTGVCALVNGQQVAIFRPAATTELFAIGNFDPFGKANVFPIMMRHEGYTDNCYTKASVWRCVILRVLLLYFIFFGYFTSLYLPLQESSCQNLFPNSPMGYHFEFKMADLYRDAMHINGTFHNLNYE